MIRYLARRLVHAVVVVWAAFTLSFLILFIIPGDPVALMLGDEALASTTPQQLTALRAQYGTDQPLLAQYGNQLVNLLHGDLGHSYKNGIAVSTTLAQAAPSTFALAGTALVVGVLAGIGIAAVAVLTRAFGLRSLLLALPPIGVSIPTFWVGLVLLQVFSFQLGWLPAFGDQGPRGLILPTLTLAVPVSAVTAQVLHSGLERTMSDPYAEVVRAKGAGRFRLFLHHGLRNAALPSLTTVGVMVAGLLGGSVVTETVFSRTGLGQIAATAVSQKDIPVVQGVVLVATVVFVIVSLLVDVLYSVLDPRIRLAGATR